MADNKTTYLENAVLDHVLGNGAFTPPAALYLGLFTSAPDEDGVGTEVSSVATGYARVAITFAVAAAGVTSNDVAIVFAKSTAAWGNVTHFGIFDAITVGNVLFKGALTSGVNVDAANRKVEFEVGALTITES